MHFYVDGVNQQSTLALFHIFLTYSRMSIFAAVLVGAGVIWVANIQIRKVLVFSNRRRAARIWTWVFSLILLGFFCAPPYSTFVTLVA